MEKIAAAPGGFKITDIVKIRAFADHSVSLGEKHVREAIQTLIEEAKKVGLQISQVKTEFMEVARHGHNNVHLLKIYEVEIKKVQTSKYLGS